jgi:hypothetical protein
MKKFRSRWDKPSKPTITIYEDRSSVPWRHYVIEDGKEKPVARSWAENEFGYGRAKFEVIGVRKNPKKRRKTKKRRTRKIKRAVSLHIVKRRKRKIQRVKRNPVGRFVICATLENGKHFYFRKSTESFVAGLVAATRYKSVAVAMRTAKLLLKQLPREIVSIKVDAVKK